MKKISALLLSSEEIYFFKKYWEHLEHPHNLEYRYIDSRDQCNLCRSLFKIKFSKSFVIDMCENKFRKTDCYQIV